ncbi:hypothetical protein [Pediococcus pentosaceus]|uniref:hypothetical protein n=1 Tax=Pediococcus pentosaceus TaxID=1255 RepID=UPI0018FECB36|nr:hypothetical protein [Pediococcus pentosaceus]MBF7121418.1 hypothetical protein [Pediococcus pentosaceus]
MNLNNFIKSTAELRSHLILKGDREQLFFVSGIIVNTLQKEILLTLTLNPHQLPLSQFRTKTIEAPREAKILLFNPETKLKTHTFGYYLRDQYLVIK